MPSILSWYVTSQPLMLIQPPSLSSMESEYRYQPRGSCSWR